MILHNALELIGPIVNGIAVIRRRSCAQRIPILPVQIPGQPRRIQ